MTKQDKINWLVNVVTAIFECRPTMRKGLSKLDAKQIDRMYNEVKKVVNQRFSK